MTTDVAAVAAAEAAWSNQPIDNLLPETLPRQRRPSFASGIADHGHRPTHELSVICIDTSLTFAAVGGSILDSSCISYKSSVVLVAVDVILAGRSAGRLFRRPQLTVPNPSGTTIARSRGLGRRALALSRVGVVHRPLARTQHRSRGPRDLDGGSPCGQIEMLRERELFCGRMTKRPDFQSRPSDVAATGERMKSQIEARHRARSTVA